MSMITQDWCELTPAYGRDYTKKADVIADFLAGKDFEANMPGEGMYCSVRDFMPGTKVILRYKHNMSTAVCTVPAAKQPTSKVNHEHTY